MPRIATLVLLKNFRNLLRGQANQLEDLGEPALTQSLRPLLFRLLPLPAGDEEPSELRKPSVPGTYPAPGFRVSSGN